MWSTYNHAHKKLRTILFLRLYYKYMFEWEKHAYWYNFEMNKTEWKMHAKM